MGESWILQPDAYMEKFWSQFMAEESMREQGFRNVGAFSRISNLSGKISSRALFLGGLGWLDYWDVL